MEKQKYVKLGLRLTDAGPEEEVIVRGEDAKPLQQAITTYWRCSTHYDYIFSLIFRPNM